MELKRVVITGLGVLSPLGNDVSTMWQNLLQGVSGAGPITQFDASKFRTQFANEVRDFDASSFLDRKEARKLDRVSQFALYASDQAISDSKLNLEIEDKDRIGVIWSSGMGGLRTFEDEVMDYAKGGGTPRFNPFFIPKVITNISAGQISIRYGFRGPNFCVTSACASSAHAICEAVNYLRLGKANVIVTGGCETPISATGVGGFNSLHALSTRNDDALTACRPFSASRDGFVLGEGAASLVLEEYEHAKARGAHIYAEVVGCGLSSDAYHITAPDPEGEGASLVMRLALEDANIKPEQIDYINAHGTSTPLGDLSEVKAIMKTFGEHAYAINITSSKSMTGHLLGATGALETVIMALSIQNGIVTPTINHAEGDDDEQIDNRLNFTFNKAQKRNIRFAMSNTFGFGGHNATIILKNIN